MNDEEEFDEDFDDEDEMTDEEREEQAKNDARIMFFLRLLINDYDPEDVARVAMDLLEIYEQQFICKDCDTSVMEKREFFLVHPELEAQVGLEDGCLCVECFEKRLGRELNAFDFIVSAMNQMHENYDHSDLLKSRLLAGLEETLGDEAK